MNMSMPDFEVGDLLCCRILGEEKDGYSVCLVSDANVVGYYPCKSNLAKGVRIEACFVCMDGDKFMLAPKSYLKQRQQLTKEETISDSPEFSPMVKVSPPGVDKQTEDNIIDFSPPSDFNTEFIALIRKWQLVDAQTEKELSDKVKSGKWEIVGLLKPMEIFTPQELTSIDFGRNLLKREKISWTQFKKAFFDELSVGILIEDSELIGSRS